MKSTHLLLIVAAAGLLVGFAGSRFSGTSSADVLKDGSSPAEREVPTRSSRDLVKRTSSVGSKVDLPFVSSSDTMETLKALPPEDLYGRLALWMIDASQDEIAGFWMYYHSTEDQDRDITDLIFINWARIDPQAAVDAAKGTNNEQFSWWAWACHDPAGSLAAAIAQNPGRVHNVTWGLGEFHPDWVREHWEMIPEKGKQNALLGMAKWDDVGNPLEILDFLEEKGYGFHERIFKVLIEKDPWAAYERIQKNGGEEASRYGGSANSLRTFVDTLAESKPEILEQIAARTPSGELKRTMESSFFNQLLKTDPEAALQQAMNTKASKVAEERLAAVGLSLLSEQPDRAFEMAERLLAVSPDAFGGRSTLVYDGGSWAQDSISKEVRQLMSALVAKDPNRAMELATNSGDHESPQHGIRQVGEMWAKRDLDGYADWVNEQQDPVVHTQAVGVVVNKLMMDSDFSGAADWTVSIADESSRSSHLNRLFASWSHNDPGQARAWLERAELSPSQKAQLQNYVPEPP